VFNEALGQVIGKLLLEADALYQRGSTGIAHLPRDCRGAILAAATIYAEIGRVVSDRSMDSVNDRAVVGNARKLTLLCLAKARAQLPQRCDTSEALPAIAFLVNACQQRPRRAPGNGEARNFDERCEWVIDLFERLSTPGRQI
jgi:phytoene synthase